MIRYCEEKKLFQLDTINTTYVIGLTQEGYVGHVYYGDRLFGEAVSTLLRTEEPPFTPSKNLRESLLFLISFQWNIRLAGSVITERAVLMCEMKQEARQQKFFISPTSSQMVSLA